MPLTESSWYRCTKIVTMLTCLRRKVSPRKLRLFAVACCRRYAPFLTDERSIAALEISENYADGNAYKSELQAAHAAALRVGFLEYDQKHAANRTAAHASKSVAFDAAMLTAKALCIRPADPAMEAKLCGLFREIVGHPYQPLVVEPSWLAWNDRTVVRLAQAIYQDRAFERLPILADALEEAGCDKEEMLRHCRESEEHVRGCWPVDLLLGKE